VLKSPKHSRETMLEFKEDWELLQYARERVGSGGRDSRISALSPTTAVE
jgi:hypothetical protein